MRIKHKLKSLLPWILAPMLLLALALACGSNDDDAVAKNDMGLVWEAWGKMGESYADPESLETEPVVGGALRSMARVAEAPLYPFLTQVGRVRGQSPPQVPTELADIWRGMLVHQRNWPDIEVADLVTGTIRGMVSGLGEPVAGFVDAEAYPMVKENIEENLEGEYRGIGSRVVAQDDQVLLFPFPDSPSEKAGVEAGDALVAVEGESVAGKDLEEVVELVADPAAAKVTLLVERRGSVDPLEIEVFRDIISLRSVTRQLMPGGIGHISVGIFRDNTGEQVFDALEELNQFDMLALILDLRSNAGGSEQSAADVAGQFLPEGSLFMYTVDRQGNRLDLTADEDVRRLDLGDMPIVVLVNEDTAGEAEAVAAVLQETKRAVIMGTETLGKGGTYNFVELSDGSAMYFPTHRWYTPLGNALGGNGLQPELPVESFSDSGGVTGESQFNRAYEFLNDQLPPFR